MKIQVAIQHIHAEITQTLSEHPLHTSRLNSVIGRLPEVNFSVAHSITALQSLRDTRTPEREIELESWLKSLSKEIIRAGELLHKRCTCGNSLLEHTYEYFLSFIMTYIECEILEKMHDPEFTKKAKIVAEAMYTFYPRGKNFDPINN